MAELVYVGGKIIVVSHSYVWRGSMPHGLSVLFRFGLGEKIEVSILGETIFRLVGE